MKNTKILLMMGGSRFKEVFPQDILDKLASLGELTINAKANTLNQDELKALVADVDAIVTSWGAPKLTPEVLDAAPNLKFIGHAAGSVKNIVPVEAFDKGITVTNAARVMGSGVGEMNLTFMLASLRNLTEFHENKKAGIWQKNDRKVKGLFYQKVGVVGLGNTAREMLKLLKPFECEVIAYDPYVSDEVAESLGVTKKSLHDVMKESTIICLHAPILPNTYHMIGATELALIQDGAIFINTARGWLIDHDALVEEAKKGRFQICLDVTDPEPLPAGHPLWEMENVMLTPHIAGPTPDRRRDMGQDIADKLEAFLKGEPLVDIIDKKRYEHMA